MALRLPFLPSESPPTPTVLSPRCHSSPPPLLLLRCRPFLRPPPRLRLLPLRRRIVPRGNGSIASETDGTNAAPPQGDASPEEDLEYVARIKQVLKLLKQNRDMQFEEVKLTIMIEDPREAERKRLLGIDDDEVAREDLVAALDDVNEGRIPQDRVALRLLAEEITQWPNLEVEISKKKPSASPYAKVTDTGVDPKVAAKRLNVDWDAAAEVESEEEESSETEVPPVMGYGALYLLTALPVIIGISVVLILFYNSLQ